ncbi:MAG: FtsX-like permease family protein [Candidatus Thorarchaeota archaeon]
MAAVPAGYQAFHSLPRKAVTLLCFLLASAMVMGISVYVDSNSVNEWDDLTDIGPIAMTVGGDGVENQLTNIRDIPGVEKAAAINYRHGELFVGGGFDLREWWGMLPSLTSDYLNTFPEVFNLETGRFPNNISEIALAQFTYDYLEVDIGSIVNLTVDYGEFGPIGMPLTVVGLYGGSDYDPFDPYYYYYDRVSGIGVVHPDIVWQEWEEVEVHVEIDRTSITPFDARGSMAYVVSIEESIRALDSQYPSPNRWSRYYVSGYLSNSIMGFLTWQFAMRLTQILRAAGVVVLAGMVIFLAIRHNINERRFESNMLISRGAAKAKIESIEFRETLGLSILSSIVGLGVGAVVSRIAMTATGYFEFDFSLLWTQPFLITIESIALALVFGTSLPIATFIFYRSLYSTRKSEQEKTSKLARIAKGLTIIKWDVLVAILTSLLLAALYLGGTAVQNDPILGIVLSVAPLALFLSFASLTIKGMKRGANLISRGFRRIVGEIPATVGIRRIGKGASSAGPAALVLVLAMSLAWNNAVIGASLPLTKRNHARFAFGADATFHLNEIALPDWDEFIENVTNHELTQAGTLVSVTELYLSATWGGEVDAVTMNPLEYLEVGYDQFGQPLNESDIGDMLSDLQLTLAGAIISSDVAVEYEVSVGDTLRAATSISGVSETMVFTIVGIAEALSNNLLTTTGHDYWWGMTVGTDALWVNREYVESLVDLEQDARNVYCIRAIDGANDTILVEDTLQAGGDSVVGEDWASVSNEVGEYLRMASYQMDRAVDTMLTVVMVGIIFGAFTVYAVEGIRARKREIALLRAMGASSGQIVKAQGAEMLVLAIVSTVLLMGYGPLMIMNTLLTYRVTTYAFPIPIFASIPWLTLVTIVVFFLASIIVFVLAIAFLSSKVNLSEALNASWAESGPYGGDV